MSKTVFVTVGTTEFDSLIQSLTKDSIYKVNCYDIEVLSVFYLRQQTIFISTNTFTLNGYGIQN